MLRQHDRIIAAAASSNGGETFGSEGDAQFLVFDDAVSAVAATVQAQRDLAGHTWPDGHALRVRMGVHSGTAERDDSGFVGMVLHETARIAAAGHGGQVLVSPASTELIGNRLPAGVALEDLGVHSFRDLDEPLRIQQLVIDGLRADFPPLRASGGAPTQLPGQPTAFVDRGEVKAIIGLSETSRLLTLTGPGGTGKTRLAIAVAERIHHRFSDGTWFVGLEAVSEPDLVPAEIVTTLGLSGSSEPPLERLIEHLRSRTVLLVLDNLEQVVEAGEIIARVIRECPGVNIVATSRTPLRVYGEQEFPVPALELPPATSSLTADEARAYGSIRLFEERAQGAKPSFVLSDDSVAVATEIVNRLDGLPLAIELAAARLRMLPLAALRRRLDDRLGTLSSGSRDLPSRQQTLRGAITWSYDLLDQPDRRLFARLGTVAGSAALSQVEAICGPADEIGREVFDGLESLTQQSLVRVVDSGEDEPRFAMLASIREYARERLADSGEGELIARRHAEAYLALAEELAPEIIGADAGRASDRLERDHDEFRAALEWIIANDQAELGLRMIVALWRFWQVRGHLHEADDRIHDTLAMASVETQSLELRSRTESAAGGIAYWRSHGEATYRHYQAALQLAQRTDDKALLADALYNAGFAPLIEDTPTGYERMLSGGPYFGQALALFEELGDEGGIARTSWSLAIEAAVREDVNEARALAMTSLEAARSIDDRYQVGWSLHLVGQSDLVVGDVGAAARHLGESLDIWVEAGDVRGMVLLLLDAALVARTRKLEASAWRLIGAENRLRLDKGTHLGAQAIDFPRLDPNRTPDTDEQRRWFDEGRSLTMEAAIAIAREALQID